MNKYNIYRSLLPKIKYPFEDFNLKKTLVLKKWNLSTNIKNILKVHYYDHNVCITQFL